LIFVEEKSINFIDQKFSDRYLFIKQLIESKGFNVILVNSYDTLKKIRENQNDKIKFIEYLEKDMSKKNIK